MMVGWFVLVYREGHGNYDQFLFNLVLYVTIIQFFSFKKKLKTDDS
jgi:hypothetical protein